ncbi:volume-regulated anion channel subunit LRRC8D [Phycodurus eques]|uniref:volume-regulated anion channel subunit LRRC8D n=1 Tax=Phycodurus eques TaxID=693459 RepID=UPI002ACEF192|nr:volume-regulated anion channel subunit LRRC8D [Phycodurus eques]
MFSLSELVSLEQHENRSKLLKPWWEVFMDYTVVLMLMTSVLASTVQLSRDKVVCIPLNTLASVNSSYNPSDSLASRLPAHIAPDDGQNLHLTPSGRRTHLVYHQYVYVSQVCSHEILPWSSRFFPYVALLLSLMLVASGSFWLHFPRTSACIEHFLAILAKCCESPWTSQALTHTARQENLQDKQVPQKSLHGHLRGESNPSRPFLKQSDSPTPPSPCPSSHSIDSTVTVRLTSSSAPFPSHSPPCPRQGISLDKSDGEEARALFERVKRFRSHCESSDVIYKVYLAQTIFKLLMVTLILSYIGPLLSAFSFTHICHPEVQPLVGYATFQCIHVLSSLLHKLLLTYLTLLGLYGLLNFYTLSWILYNSLREYPFDLLKETKSQRDMPELRNDLAFLLHMLDQYDPLLVQHLSVFLCPDSESNLLDTHLEGHWGKDKLRDLTTSDHRGRTCLQLVALPQLPPALFTLSHLQVLKLELITDARFTVQVSDMTSLRELHLYQCTAIVEPSALRVLQERLEVLSIVFAHSSEIPSWVVSLRSLHELHLSGRLGRSWPLRSLRNLLHLRALVIHGMLQQLPGVLHEVAGSLVRLEVSNEDAKLLGVSSLKQMVELTELQLRGCQLERLPSSLQALNKLQALDIHNNRLRTLGELSHLAHLNCLSCLRLSNNHIGALPACIDELKGLAVLDLCNNQLLNIPLPLFSLCNLQKLLLAGNLLERLPAEVKALQQLTELDISRNRLQRLPSELFTNCMKLCLLNVSHNSLRSLPVGISSLNRLCKFDLRNNSLCELPAELGRCSGLRGGGLLVEYCIFLSLPPRARDFLSNSCCLGSNESDLDDFPHVSPSQWRFSSAMESQI